MISWLRHRLCSFDFQYLNQAHVSFVLFWKNSYQNQKKFKDSDHHELLDLVQSVEVSSPLQELAGGDEVAAA